MSRGKYQTPKAPAMNFAILMAFVLFWLVMVTTYLSAGLYAKYTTGGSGKDDARVISFKQLVVAENGVDNATGQQYIFAPGVNLAKDITVSFGGSESDTFVFVELDTPGWTQDAAKYAFALTREDATIMSWEVIKEKEVDGKMVAEWTHLSSNGDKHVYYRVLEANETLENVQVIKDGEITVPVATQANYTYLYTALAGTGLNINATAHVVQANGFYNNNNMVTNALEAWNSLNS